MRSKSSRRIAWAGLILLMAAGLALSIAWRARAAEFSNNGFLAPKEVIDDDVFVSSDEVKYLGTVNGDLFINSTTAQIDGTVNGNVIANSGVLVVNGQVNGSLVFSGQTARIAGKVSGTVYALGREVIVEQGGRVGRNIFYAGLSLTSRPGSQVGRDVFFTGYQALLSGETGRDVQARLGALTLDGKVGRDMNVVIQAPDQSPNTMRIFLFQNMRGTTPVELSPSGLKIQPQAVIGGRLSYASPVQQNQAILAKPAKGVIFELKPETGSQAQLTPADQLRQQAQKAFRELVTLLLLGGLALWLAPRWLNRSGEQAARQPLPAVVWGFLGLVGGFAGSFLLLVVLIVVTILIAVTSLGGLAWTVFGVGSASLALAFSVFIMLISYGSKVVIGYQAGKLLLQRTRSEALMRPVWGLAAGVILYVLLAQIPLAGWLISFAVTLAGLGAIWLAARPDRKTTLSVVEAAPAGD